MSTDQPSRRGVSGRHQEPPIVDSADDAARPSGPGPRYSLIFAAVAALSYALDVISKVAAVEVLAGREPVEVVGAYFTLTLARNPGAAFSTGTSYTPVLTAIAVIATVVVLWLSRRLGSTLWAVGLGFLLGGIAGNLTDRLLRSPGPLRGHVVDFFAFPSFPVFNIADICINIAAATILVQALRGVRIDGRQGEDASARGTS